MFRISLIVVNVIMCINTAQADFFTDLFSSNLDDTKKKTNPTYFLTAHQQKYSKEHQGRLPIYPEERAQVNQYLNMYTQKTPTNDDSFLNYWSIFCFF